MISISRVCVHRIRHAVELPATITTIGYHPVPACTWPKLLVGLFACWATKGHIRCNMLLRTPENPWNTDPWNRDNALHIITTSSFTFRIAGQIANKLKQIPSSKFLEFGWCVDSNSDFAEGDQIQLEVYWCELSQKVHTKFTKLYQSLIYLKVN